MEKILNEAARLFAQGFGVHWIKPNSKAPVESQWADGTRQDLIELRESIMPGYGLGVRLGAASKLSDGSYLANLDVDIKSGDPRHEQEALSLARQLFPGIDNAAAVKTGYGFRFFFRTEAPAKSRRLGCSNERVKVLMPTSPVSGEQLKARDSGIITDGELKKGFRVRSAWELEIMSAGKQVVLPPSIHPDTKKEYVWLKQFGGLNDLPLFNVEGLKVGKSGTRLTKPAAKGQPFEAAVIDYALDTRFSPHMLRLIFGDGVGDRSAAAFSLSIAMLKAGFSELELVTVLTDRETFIGEMAFEHRKTESRQNAADWARRYCVEKAIKEADAAEAFRNQVVITSGGLSDDEAGAQAKALVQPDSRPWQSRLTRGGKDGQGAIKPTLENTLLIIRNVVSPGVFRKDVFRGREFYGTKAPWTGAELGKALTDDDAIAIKAWLGPKFGFEPGVGTIFEAMAEIARQNEFNPVRDELEALAPWDGTPRIDTWLAKYFNAEGPPGYLAQVFRKWLVASISRTYTPGFKFDWMPILEGPQGVGKSIFGSILFGSDYFSDWLPNLGDKDAALGLVGRRCIEFGELDRMRRNEVETVKAFVTRTTDVVRPPYGRKSVELPRSVVFFGTTNREHYLQDDTGNRRFCPIKVGALDWAAIERDRDQLWAEALIIFQLGLESTLYLEGDAVQAAKEMQNSKQVQDDSDAMADVLVQWLEKEKAKAPAERFDVTKFKLIQLFHDAFGPFGNYNYEMRHLKMASKALKKLGFDSKRTMNGVFWHLIDSK